MFRGDSRRYLAVAGARRRHDGGRTRLT